MRLRGVDKYEFKEWLGRGAAGDVYLAWDKDLDRMVAVKVIHVDQDPSGYLKEAQRLKRLEHLNIVRMYDARFVPDESLVVIIMEPAGPSLRTRLKTGVPLTTDACQTIASHLLNGLSYAHSQGYLHRDIKPENIFVTTSDIAKIGDFGSATELLPSELTHGMGTHQYMSPEAFLGGGCDKSSDVWSVGIVLYEMLTGSLPFRVSRQHDFKEWEKLYQSDPVLPPITDHGNEADQALQQVIRGALALSKKDRYPTADEMLDALKERKLYLLPNSPEEERQYKRFITLFNDIEKCLRSALGESLPFAESLKEYVSRYPSFPYERQLKNVAWVRNRLAHDPTSEEYFWLPFTPDELNRLETLAQQVLAWVNPLPDSPVPEEIVDTPGLFTPTDIPVHAGSEGSIVYPQSPPAGISVPTEHYNSEQQEAHQPIGITLVEIESQDASANLSRRPPEGMEAGTANIASVGNVDTAKTEPSLISNDRGSAPEHEETTAVADSSVNGNQLPQSNMTAGQSYVWRHPRLLGFDNPAEIRLPPDYHGIRTLLEATTYGDEVVVFDYTTCRLGFWDMKTGRMLCDHNIGGRDISLAAMRLSSSLRKPIGGVQPDVELAIWDKSGLTVHGLRADNRRAKLGMPIAVKVQSLLSGPPAELRISEPEGHAVCFRNHRLEVWNLETAQCEHSQAVNDEIAVLKSFSVSSSGKYALFNYIPSDPRDRSRHLAEQTIGVYDVQHGKPQFEIQRVNALSAQLSRVGTELVFVRQVEEKCLTLECWSVIKTKLTALHSLVLDPLVTLNTKCENPIVLSTSPDIFSTSSVLCALNLVGSHGEYVNVYLWRPGRRDIRLLRLGKGLRRVSAVSFSANSILACACGIDGAGVAKAQLSDVSQTCLHKGPMPTD